MGKVLQLERLETDLEQKAREFVSPLLAQLDAAGLSREFGQVDHVCYRVSDMERYEELKGKLASFAALLSEAFINGRPIATYKFSPPLKVTDHITIDLLELPAPRQDAAYQEGFEHIEVVTTAPLEELLARHGHQPFNKSNLPAKVNRDVSLKFDGGLVKFHESSLEQVIAVEKADLAAQTVRPMAIIDLDDTIADSREPFLKAVHAALEQHFAKTIELDEVRAKARPTFPEFFANFGIQGEAMVSDLLTSFQAAWPHFAEECRIPVGMQSLLSCLQSEGVEIHLWTARDKTTALAVLDEAGLSHFFAQVHAFDGVTNGKPLPPMRLEAACRGALSCAMLGDSQSDVMAAASLGAEFFQAAWVHEKKLGMSPDIVCRTPSEALTRMLQYFRQKSLSA